MQCQPEPRAARWLAGLVALAAGLAAAQSPDVNAPSDQPRWVDGSNVNLRSAPTLSSEVLARLPLNARVLLRAAASTVPAAANSGYCQVRWEPTLGGPVLTGYTACRYLGLVPVPTLPWLQAQLPDGSTNAQFDPLRLFWLAPSWAALAAYAHQLEALQLPAAKDEASAALRRATVRPPDAELERMKAHLALGIHGPQPKPLLAWVALQRQAQQVAGDPGAAERAAQLVNTLGLHGPVSDGSEPPGHGGVQAAGLVRAIALPRASPSLFGSQRDVAALHEDTAALSGRFGIIHTHQTRPRQSGADDAWDAGVWDMARVTTALVRPLVRSTVFRDGRLHSAPSHARRTQNLWGDVDGPMCEGFVGGFALGDSEPRIWGDYGVAEYNPARLPNPPGSLVVLHTRRALPLTMAPVVSQPLQLDRARTGFVRATQWHFDLDADGVPDLVAIEGVGRGPGHLDGPTKTDDAWYRLFFANIAGRWFVLGHDAFAYGCGC